jgi:hypothetical protein
MFDHLQRLSMNVYSCAGRRSPRAFLGRHGGRRDRNHRGHSLGVLPSLDVLSSTALLFLLEWRLALFAMLV